MKENTEIKKLTGSTNITGRYTTPCCKLVMDYKKIKTDSIVIHPVEQNQVIKFGNSVEISIKGKIKKIFIDGVPGLNIKLPNNLIITSDTSNLGLSLMGKKAGETGFFKIKNFPVFFTVEKIRSYTETCKLFFPEFSKPDLAQN